MTTPEPRTAAIISIMTPDPSTIDRSDRLSEAYGVLRSAPFHHLVVMDADVPVGVLATSDILRLVYDADGVGERALRTYIDHQFTIDDAMSVDLRTLTTDATIRDAAAMLSDGSFHSVVVLDIDGALAGIVTTTDLARYLRATVCDGYGAVMSDDDAHRTAGPADLLRSAARGGRAVVGGLWVRASRLSRSPASKARAAHARGDSVFQHTEAVDPSQGHGGLLSKIEAEGWRLEDTRHITDTDTETDPDGRTHTHTTTHAIYDFRRVDPS